MEVHAHSHTPRKKWTHYLWEFFMLFLAVFCGFLAEYKFEHMVEHQREKKYARQLVDGLKQDTAELNMLINFGETKRKSFDTLFRLLQTAESSEKWTGIYRHVFMLEQRRRFFAPFHFIFDQVKNSGAFRYFRSQDVVNRLTTYKRLSDRLIHQHEMEFDYISKQVTPFIDNHFSRKEMKRRFSIDQVLKTTGRDTIILNSKQKMTGGNAETQLAFENIVFKAAEWFHLPNENAQDVRKHAGKLIELILEEYHLK
jgi:hypothetical protein